MRTPCWLLPSLLAVAAALARGDDFVGRFDLRGQVASGDDTRVVLEVERGGTGLVVHRTAWIGRGPPVTWSTRDARVDGADGALWATFRPAGDAAAVTTARWAARPGGGWVESLATPLPWRWSNATGRRLGPDEITCRAAPIALHGRPDERYDIVFVADGWRARDLPAFRAKVEGVVATLRATEPFGRYWSAINVHVVDVASALSGVRQAPGGLGTRVSDPGWGALPAVDRRRATDAARLAAPDPEAVVLLVDERFRSRAWRGITAVSARDRECDRVVVHELGHVVGLLLDEYEERDKQQWDFAVASSWTTDVLQFSGWGSNVTTLRALEQVPWRRWIEPGTPLPTARGSGVSVGLYLGGLFMSQGIYRPSETCCMRDHDAPFCPVCREAIVLRLARRAFPLRPAARADAGGAWRFEVATTLPGAPLPRWRLDGAALGEGAHVVVRPEQVRREVVLRLDVRDESAWVRNDPYGWSTTSAEWTLTRGGAGLAVDGPRRIAPALPPGEDLSMRLEQIAGQ